MDDNVTSLLKKIDTLGRNLSSSASRNASQRSELRVAARKLSLALEEPRDTVERVCFQVRNLQCLGTGTRYWLTMLHS